MRKNLEWAQSLKLLAQPQQKNIRIVHADIGHHLKGITWVTDSAMGLNLTGMFKPCKDCALVNAKIRGVSKKVDKHFKVLGESLHFDISSPSTTTFGGSMCW